MEIFLFCFCLTLFGSVSFFEINCFIFCGGYGMGKCSEMTSLSSRDRIEDRSSEVVLLVQHSHVSTPRFVKSTA